MSRDGNDGSPRTTTPHWGLADIPDQSGKTIVVTGANSGLGEVAARALAARGAHVILACRNTEKGRAAAARMPGTVTVRQLDLADLSSVRRFAKETGKIDVLINNAGVMAVPEGRTVDGFETQMGTNFLGAFALTGLLLPKITERVVTLSSLAHRVGRIELADLNWVSRRYQRWPAYAQSKLADLIFATELQRRLTETGSPVLSVAAHPGFSRTELHTHTDPIQGALIAAGTRLSGQDSTMGALPSLFAATSPDVQPGGYYGPAGLGEIRGHPGPAASASRAQDPVLATVLWNEAARLTDVDFLPLPPGTASLDSGEAAGKTDAVSGRLLAGLLIVTAGLHLLRPQTFEDSIPPVLPGRPRTWVYASGVMLAATGTAILHPRTRRVGAMVAAGLFVGVFPANIQMVRNATTAAQRAILILRLPLQIPLVAWALNVSLRYRRGR